MNYNVTNQDLAEPRKDCPECMDEVREEISHVCTPTKVLYSHTH